MKYKKITGIGAVCAGMRLAGASCVFAANEQANAMQEKEETTREADAAVQNTDEENLVKYEIIKSEYGMDVAETSGSTKIIKKADENAGNDENTKKMIQTKIKKKKRLYCGYMMRIRIRRS